MADNKLEYRLVIKDDGTVTLKKVATEVDALGKKIETTSTGTAGTNQKLKDLTQTIDTIPTKTKPATEHISNLDKTMGRIQRTALAFMAMWALTKILSFPEKLISTGIQFNSILEQSRLGIAAILTAQGKFVDSQGIAAEGMQALNLAQNEASKISKQLQLDNLETAATYEQLVKAYQQTLAPGLEVGFNTDQIRQYTVAMVQAASAMGINLDMMAEETRSMLRGSITPRNTLIASALGIRNEDITKYKGDVQGLYNFIMDRLSAFGTAGQIAQTTWVGVLSNIKDAIAQVLGEGFLSTFEGIKSIFMDLQQYLIIRTPEGLQPNPEVVAGFRVISDSIVSIINGAREIGNWLSQWSPLLSLVYELIRFIYSAFVPILRLFGLVGTSTNSWMDLLMKAVGWISKIIEKFNDWTLGTIQVTKGMKELGEVLDREDKETGEAMKAGLSYVPRLPKYTQEQEDEAIKLRIQSGAYLGEEVTYSTAISKTLEERIGLMTTARGIQLDINNLTKEERAAIIMANREMEKAQLNPEDKDLWYTIVLQNLDKIKAANSLTAVELRSQIAGENKDYATQIKLIQDINEQKILQAELSEKGINDEVKAAMRAATKAKQEGVKRQQVSEPLGYREEILTTQAAMAGMRGDIETQVKLERESVNIAIQKRQVNLDLRGVLGKEDAELLKIKSSYEGIVKLTNSRLEKETAITSLRSNIAEATGNYQAQARLIFEANENEIEKLSNEGKFNDLLGYERKYLMERLAILKFGDTLLKGDVDLQNKRIELEGRLAAVSMDQTGIYKSQEDALEQNIRLLQRAADVIDGSKYPELKASLQNIVNLTKQVGPAEISLAKTKDMLDVSTRFATLHQQISELTGDTQEYDDNIKILTRNQIELLSLDPKTAPFAVGLGVLMERLAKLNDLTVQFNRLQTTAQLKSDIAQLAGSWEGVKNAEQELLNVETQRKILVGGLTKEGKKYAIQYYELKSAEIEAARMMNANALAEIGMKKYALKVAQDLADFYQNYFPQAIDMTANSISNLTTDLVTGAKSWTEAWNDFFKSITSGLVRLASDLIMTIAKMEMLKAMGYGTTGATGSGGGINWGSLIMTALGAYFGGGAQSVDLGGGYGAGAGTMTPQGFAGGGIITKPTLAMAGEGGRAEAFIPLQRGKVPVEVSGAKQSPAINVQMTVVTPDANSFQASRKQIIGGMFSESARAAMRNS